MSRAVKNLIIINISVFLLMHFVPGLNWLRALGLVPNAVFFQLKIWQLASYLFLHLGLWHLVVNMLMLGMFGPSIEASWGSKEFLRYYFFTGIGAGLCTCLSNFGSTVPVIGASGAIFGLLVAYALMFPETVILLFFVFPMKIKQAVIVLAGINLLGALSEPGASIAYFAHLGGGLFGYLYLRNEWLRRRLFYWRLPDFKAWRVRQRNKAQQHAGQQVDAILDKISRQGLASLTQREKRILESRSKKPEQ